MPVHSSASTAYRRLGLLAACVVAVAAPAAAQLPLDRVVGNGPSGLPLMFHGQWPQLIGGLARVTGVPMGVEAVDTGVLPPDGTALTGLRLRDALDKMAALTRYEWREVDGVIVLRPLAAWNAPSHPLDQFVNPVRLDDGVAQQALAVACAVMGANDSPLTAERRRFSLTFPGGRLIDFLNGVAREHGALAWSFTHTPRMPLPWRVSVGFQSGSSGVACGAPGTPPETDVNLQALVAARAVPLVRPEAVLDRPVGTNVHGQPLMLYGNHASGLRDLATAARVPMGLELALGRPLIHRPGFAATGAPLRLVLDALVTIDPRYEWRFLDGVVVMRPRDAWDDPGNPLNLRSPSVRLLDQPIGKLVSAAQMALGAERPSEDFPDSRLVWVDLPPGPAFELLCAVARAHGDLVWAFEEADPDIVKATGLRHQLMLLAPSGGSGIPVK